MRYIIGIDLGTTNSCVSYIDTTSPSFGRIQLLKIPQLVQAGIVESKETLPSLCYLTAKEEWPKGSLSLPWNHHSQLMPSYFVGQFAASQGVKTPTRYVHSAKSWLSHPAALRKDKMLPLDAICDSQRISPKDASSYYLQHIKDVWNFLIAKGDPQSEFDAQAVILTVPASFDEIARTLTVESARLAGYKEFTLLEEPQAAFYSWMATNENHLSTALSPGDLILVCDVGGGTSDFSLIEVFEERQALGFKRVAVGEHLLLGGDNMDAAVSQFVEHKFQEKGHHIPQTQRLELLHQAQLAKEVLLTTDTSYQIVLQGSGSKVIQGSMTTTITSDEILHLLLGGFFGAYSWDEALCLKKAKGIRAMGLAYEDDPSITKHLANFLSKYPKKIPTHILFNGGAMKPIPFQEAIVQSIKSWFPHTLQIKILSTHSLDTAVSHGAAYYGMARCGYGIKIQGGMARGIYLAVEEMDQLGHLKRRALCLLPRGSSEEDVFKSELKFLLTPNEKVSFQLLTSSERLEDRSGDLVEITEVEMSSLALIQTVLRYGKSQSQKTEKIKVHLRAFLTTIGIIEIGLNAIDSAHTWKLEFQTKSAQGAEMQSVDLLQKQTQSHASTSIYDLTFLQSIDILVCDIFADKTSSQMSKLMNRLEELIAIPKQEFPISILPTVSDALIKCASFRKNTVEHNIRWWNALGYSLRPGNLYPIDDFRIKEFWKIVLQDFQSKHVQEVMVQMWICYRRIAAGLNKGQQTQLASILFDPIFNKAGQIDGKSKEGLYLITERIRAIASFELISNDSKIKLGCALMERISKGIATPAEIWSLGRLGARLLLHGSIANVIPVQQCEKWVDRLTQLDVLGIARNDPKFLTSLASLIGQLARKTPYRQVNLNKPFIDAILDRLKDFSIYNELQSLLLNESELTRLEQEQTFGDSFPLGLIISK